MRLRRVAGNDQLILAVLAVAVGLVGGGAVIAFREGISLVQTVFFGSGTERFFLHAETLPWWWIMLAPAAGGLLVGLLIRYGLPDGRPQGVAEAIEASALKGGRMPLLPGVAAAAASALSIGSGASVGREGPAVHLGASLGGWVAGRLRLPRRLGRSMLGCGVAAAVAASFNAPIAGALFAAEVVMGEYAITSFAPVVIASVTGTAVSHGFYGDFPAFAIDVPPIRSFWEFPAFLGLGAMAGLMAVAFLKSVEMSFKAAEKVPGPVWVRPMAGGLMVGTIGVFLPQVMGVGYGATEAALVGAFPLALLIAVGVFKLAATAISLGFGFGGGVFSPSLVLGAMLGGAWGVVVTGIFPDLSSGPGAYTLVGMGAVAASVLGAPISTTLIVFEMTADYGLTMAVMVGVAVATVIARHLAPPSFFHWLLDLRGVDLARDFEAALLASIPVRKVMSPSVEIVTPDVTVPELREMLRISRGGEVFVVRDDGKLFGSVALWDLLDPDMDSLLDAGDVTRADPPTLTPDDDLKTALDLMRETGDQVIAVVGDRESMAFEGCLLERDALAAEARALIEARREERGL